MKKVDGVCPWCNKKLTNEDLERYDIFDEDFYYYQSANSKYGSYCIHCEKPILVNTSKKIEGNTKDFCYIKSIEKVDLENIICDYCREIIEPIYDDFGEEENDIVKYICIDCDFVHTNDFKISCCVGCDKELDIDKPCRCKNYKYALEEFEKECERRGNIDAWNDLIEGGVGFWD